MADKTTYTPETYQTSYVDFYNMGGIDVTKAPDPDPDPDPDPVVRPNVLDPVGGDDNSNIFTGVSLSTGKPAFKVGSVDYNEYIQNFDTNLDNQAKKGEDKSLGGFTEWAAEQLKKPEMMVGAATGVPALGGIMVAAGAMNRKKQYENASKIAATGGTGGSMFMINNQTISRAPGSRIYSGTLGNMTQEQVAAVEAINRNLIPGTMQESQNADEDGGGYSVTGKSGLASIDGAIMDAYGNIHSAGGRASASQATALREKLYVDAMTSAGYSLEGVNVSRAALEMKQALDASAKSGIGFFETVGRQDTGAYNTNLSGSQQFIQNYLAERHEEKKATPEDAGLPPTVIAAQEAAAATSDDGYPTTQDSGDDSSPAGTPTQYSFSGGSSRSGDFTGGQTGLGTGRSTQYGGGTGRGRSGYNDGGRVGLAAGGAPGAPAGFVESPPSRVSEAATVADDKPMSVPEGTFVINAAAVEFAGEEDIADMLKKAYVKAGKKDMGGPSTQEIDVAVSRGEVIVPPHIAKIIGYDRLEKINNRGKAETSKRIEENGQQPTGAAEGGFLSRLFGFGKEEPQLTSPTGSPENAPVEQPIPQEGFADMPVAEPSTPLPAFTPFENTARDLLIRLEGNTTTGYVPAGKSKSGVTVGIGFDIGQHSPTDLEKMGLNTSLIAKLTPYLKKKGKAAEDALGIVPLELNESELEEVNKIVIRKKYEEFENKFPKYANIPDEGKRAVMFSTAYIGGLNRYKTFREEFDKAQNLKRAIRVGLFGKMNRGDAEYNRAKKALNWYNEYELENMQRPTPKPARMAGGGFLDGKKFADGGEVDLEYEDKIVRDEVARKMKVMLADFAKKSGGEQVYTENFEEGSVDQEFFQRLGRMNDMTELKGDYGVYGYDVNAPTTPTLFNLFVLAEELAHVDYYDNPEKFQRKNPHPRDTQAYRLFENESDLLEEIRAKQIAFDTVGGMFPKSQKFADFTIDRYKQAFRHYLDVDEASPQVIADMTAKYGLDDVMDVDYPMGQDSRYQYELTKNRMFRSAEGDKYDIMTN